MARPARDAICRETASAPHSPQAAPPGPRLAVYRRFGDSEKRRRDVVWLVNPRHSIGGWTLLLSFRHPDNGIFEFRHTPAICGVITLKLAGLDYGGYRVVLPRAELARA